MQWKRRKDKRRLRHMACTHQGRRGNNEDAMAAEPELRLYVVADGMGGYEGGEIASRVTVETLRGFFRTNAADGDATWPVGLDLALSYPENLINAAIRLANRQVRARRSGRLEQMGSTVAALVLHNGHAVVGHVGDSRVYRLRGDELMQLTRDHSLVEEMLAAGMDLDPRSCGFSNVVTRALGTTRAAPELQSFKARPGDRYLLCTDGLTEKLDDETIRALLAGAPPEQSCPALVQRAYTEGGKDNITAVVVEVLS